MAEIKSGPAKLYLGVDWGHGNDWSQTVDVEHVEIKYKEVPLSVSADDIKIDAETQAKIAKQMIAIAEQQIASAFGVPSSLMSITERAIEAERQWIEAERLATYLGPLEFEKSWSCLPKIYGSISDDGDVKGDYCPRCGSALYFAEKAEQYACSDVTCRWPQPMVEADDDEFVVTRLPSPPVSFPDYGVTYTLDDGSRWRPLTNAEFLSIKLDTQMKDFIANYRHISGEWCVRFKG